jgi:leucyl aminopeptidase
MVEVRVRRDGRGAPRGELLFVPVIEGQVKVAVGRLDRRARPAIARRLRAAGFRGKFDEGLLHHGEDAIALLGVGPAPVKGEAWRRAGARARQEAERQRVRRVTVDLDGAEARAAAAFVEGFQLAGYRFAGYLSEQDRRPRVQTLTVLGQASGDPLASIEAVATEIFRARDLINEPASVATPRFLAERVQALARDVRGLEAQVWGPKRIAKEGLAGLLAVARGSREEPRYIRLRWAPPGARRRVILIGKGITFDSGGLSLKPPKSMETMKYDMAGGAAVIGAMRALAHLKPPIPVTALVPAVENMPGSKAQRPGDIVTSLNGKTVEVLNTDAEGRLILIDALTYAQRLGCTHMVDAATLTGSVVVALGHINSGAYSNDDGFAGKVLEAASAEGEKMWRMPMDEEYKEALKSAFADLQNIGGRPAGSITAAWFLGEFVNGKPWVHLDIAGTAWLDDAKPYMAKGPTGVTVRTFANLAMNW